MRCPSLGSTMAKFLIRYGRRTSRMGELASRLLQFLADRFGAKAVALRSSFSSHGRNVKP